MILKPLFKNNLQLIILVFIVVMSSCRKEEIESIQPEEEDTINANSSLTSLLEKTALNDGSVDNIIDRANCFTINYPVTVFANGHEILVNSQNDLENVEDVFDEFEDDTSDIDIVFPITVTLDDYSEVILNNLSEFNSLSNTCNDENEFDLDIECIDFQFPITVSTFNTQSEALGSTTLINDKAFYSFIQNIDTNDLVSIEFPITAILFDNTELTVTNFNELESIIETYKNSCDEDDDYDFDDDDCNDCTVDILKDQLISCSDWTVNRLKRNNMDYDDIYDGYSFNFFSDNTISVSWSSNTVFGTYTLTGTANTITVVIDIPSLPLCNNNWILHEIDQDESLTEIDLDVGDIDRLRYENNCN